MNNPISPGLTIKENLNALEISQKEFAERIGITEEEVTSLIEGELAITPRIAVKLSNILGSKPRYWLKLEAKYREKIEHK